MSADELYTYHLTWKARTRHALQGACHWLGIDRAWSWFRPGGGAVVLMYHSVAGPETQPFVNPRSRIPPEVFRRHMEYLARHRHVITLSMLVEALEGREPLPAGSVVVTFDDGYVDNATVAGPILKRLSLPATIFLPTRLVSSGESPWTDIVYTAIETRRRRELQIGGASYDLDREEELRPAIRWLEEQLQRATATERHDLLESLRGQLDPTAEPPDLTMSWDQVRELREGHPGIEFGGHSASHVDLSSRSDDFLEEEVAGCHAELSHQLGSKEFHFAFPYGRHDERAVAALRASDFRSSVTTVVDRARPDVDLHQIPRVDPIPPTVASIRFRTSSSYPDMSLALFGRT